VITAAFQPQGPLTLLGLTPIQIQPATGDGSRASNYRFHCLVAGYFTWASTNLVVPAGAPTAGVPSVNTIGMAAGATEKFTLPVGSWLVSSVAAAFEVSVGEGL
jgi:hypothetical protein